MLLFHARVEQNNLTCIKVRHDVSSLVDTSRNETIPREACSRKYNKFLDTVTLGEPLEILNLNEFPEKPL